MRTITDYTRMKPGALGQVVICPICNRPGLLRYYPKETFGTIIHKTAMDTIYHQVIDSCTITNNQAYSLYDSLGRKE